MRQEEPGEQQPISDCEYSDADLSASGVEKETEVAQAGSEGHHHCVRHSQHFRRMLVPILCAGRAGALLWLQVSAPRPCPPIHRLVGICQQYFEPHHIRCVQFGLSKRTQSYIIFSTMSVFAF